MSSIGTYLIGFQLLIVGLVLVAYLRNTPPLIIFVGSIMLLGVGIMTATSRTKPRDPPTI